MNFFVVTLWKHSCFAMASIRAPALLTEYPVIPLLARRQPELVSPSASPIPILICDRYPHCDCYPPSQRSYCIVPTIHGSPNIMPMISFTQCYRKWRRLWTVVMVVVLGLLADPTKQRRRRRVPTCHHHASHWYIAPLVSMTLLCILTWYQWQWTL